MQKSKIAAMNIFWPSPVSAAISVLPAPLSMWWNSGSGHRMFPLVIVDLYLHRLQGFVGERDDER